MKVKDFLQTESPLTGKKTSLLDFGSIIQMILGVVLFLFVVATGQNVAKMVSGKVGKVDTSPEPIFNSPMVSSSDTIL